MFITMFSSQLRYFLYGTVLSASLISLSVSAGAADGVFGDYFTRMIGSCNPSFWQVVTGFDTTPTTYGNRQCTGIKWILASVFGSSSAPDGQAMLGFNPDGTPKYGDVNWRKTGTDISYTAGNVGIGTATPSAKLDVTGNVFVNGKWGMSYYNQAWYDQIEFGTPTWSSVDVSFHTSGVSKMWIKPSGNVGIWTNIPEAKLHVNGWKVIIGSTTQDYLSNGWNWNYTLQLNAQDTSSIGFHDSNNNVGSIRFKNNLFTIGADDGWGVANTNLGGNLTVNGKINASNMPVPSHPEWYDLQAGMIGASTLYAYNGICTGNWSWNCTGNGGVVLNPNGSIGIWGNPESIGWGMSIHKDDWAIVTRQADGGDNKEPQNTRWSIYANDILLRSTGKWVSQMASNRAWTTVVQCGGGIVWCPSWWSQFDQFSSYAWLSNCGYQTHTVCSRDY